MPLPDGLVIRRSTRYDLAAPMQISVMPEHERQVRFARGVALDGGWVEAQLTDIGLGGLGFVAEVFFPKGVQLLARVFEQADRPHILECPVIARRTVMTDQRPAYLVGTSFGSLNDDHAHQLERLLKRLEGPDGPRS